MSQPDQPVFEGDIDAIVNDVCTVLYECVQISKIRNHTTNLNVSSDRWERLLEKNYEAQL